MRSSIKKIILAVALLGSLPLPSYAFIEPIIVQRRPIIIETQTIPPVHHKKVVVAPPVTAINKALVADFYKQVWMNNNSDAIYKYLTHGVNGYINGQHYYINDFAAYQKQYAAGHKDITTEMKSILAEGNKVAVYLSVCVTNLKIEKRICVPQVAIYTIAQQKITEFVMNKPLKNI